MSGYQLSPTAARDLDEIFDRISDRDSVDRALHVHSKFDEAFEHLVTAPSSGVKRPLLTGNRLRWWFVFKWCVIYDPTTAPLAILRVLHGARDLDRIFRSGDLYA